jgi:6-phosphogluconolactonase
MNVDQKKLCHFIVLLLLIAVSACSSKNPETSTVYVSHKRANKIVIYTLNEKTGVLVKTSEVALKGPGMICLNLAHTYLYVSNDSHITSYKINSDDSLTFMAAQKIPYRPAFNQMDEDEKIMMMSHYRQGEIATFRMNKDKSVGAEIQRLKTADKAHCIRATRDNKFVYVPHTGPDKIFQYRLNATGKLEPLKPAVLSTKGQPRHITFHPNKQFAYTINERGPEGSSVSVYKINPDGQLSFKQIISTLPESFDKTKNTCADIEIHPSGKFLYASNRGHNSIAIFKINPKDSSLSHIGRFKTQSVPRSYNISPSGAFLIAGNMKTNSLSIFRIKMDGSLKLIQHQKSEASPMWVQFIR